MNKFCIIGNVTRDAELRVTTTGVQVCTFTVAVNSNRSRRNQPADGQQTQQNDDTLFVRVSIWRERGANLVNYIKKGNRVYVDGPLQQPRIWKGQDGIEHADIQMTCDTFEFCSSKSESAAAGSYQPAPAAPQPQEENNGFTPADTTDDLPF